MAGERPGNSNTASSWPLPGISHVRVNFFRQIADHFLFFVMIEFAISLDYDYL